jgi:virginiamycin A acetyltransferase
MLYGPDPNILHPIAPHTNLVFLKNQVSSPNIIVGDYTYYADFTDTANFEKNVLYHFDFIGDKLVIGNFCAIASGVKFIMNGANHETAPISTFPFGIFGNGWEKVNEDADLNAKYPNKGDTLIGNDVWIGYDTTIMPGIKVGNGAIIAAKTVVTKDIPDYAVVGGNPAKIIRIRYDQDTIERLNKIAWWNWSAQKITEYLPLINSRDIDALEKIS